MTEEYKPSPGAGTHPITPPPELVLQWMRVNDMDIAPFHLAQTLATQAARWGSDQELEACCEWLRSKDILEPAIDALRAARRPKPPSLKKQALAVLDDCSNRLGAAHENALRRALEQLDD